MSDQITKDLGGITAYAAAVAAGYTGTKAQFETLMASYATVAQNAAASASAAADSEENAEAWAVGERGGTPVSSGDDTYNNNAKYWAEQAEDFADSIDPDKIESHIDAAYIKETASGSIATFSDGAPAPVRDLVADIVPVQSGSGDPSPDNVRPISGWTEANISVSGVNVWDEDWEVGAINTTDGSNTSLNTTIRSKNYIPCRPGASYYRKSPVNLLPCYYDKSKAYLGNGSWGASEFTTPQNCYYVRFYAYDYGTTYNNDISINYPSTDHDYHAYNGEVHTISFASAGTVYGGSIDVTSGVLVVDRARTDLGSLDWLFIAPADPFPYGYFYATLSGKKPGETNIIADIYKTYTNMQGDIDNGISGSASNSRIFVVNSAYSDANAFKTAMSGKYVVCELATPQTYQLTPTEVKTLLKSNNVWSDTGNVTVEYVADTKTFIEELINA